MSGLLEQIVIKNASLAMTTQDKTTKQDNDNYPVLSQGWKKVMNSP